MIIILREKPHGVLNLRILVTGASGLLGSRVTRELLSSGHRVLAVYNRNPVNIESSMLEKVRVDLNNRVVLEDLILKFKPQVIIHCAAYTDVDGCEVNRGVAWRVNVEATRSVVRAARVVKAHVIYVSTDYVFDGERGLYRESDEPYPINYYGLTKLLGEEIVRSSDLLYTIVRTSAIYGFGGSKKSFAEYIVEKLSGGGVVKALVDQYVSPTLNTLLAKALSEIVELRPMGTLHVAGERMSRYEFAVKVAEALGLPRENIVAARMSEMRNWVARRPRDSSLDCSRARGLLKTDFQSTSRAMSILRDEFKGVA